MKFGYNWLRGFQEDVRDSHTLEPWVKGLVINCTNICEHMKLLKGKKINLTSCTHKSLCN